MGYCDLRFYGLTVFEQSGECFDEVSLVKSDCFICNGEALFNLVCFCLHSSRFFPEHCLN